MSRDELRRLALIYRFYDEIISGRIILKPILEKNVPRGKGNERNPQSGKR